MMRRGSGVAVAAMLVGWVAAGCNQRQERASNAAGVAVATGSMTFRRGLFPAVKLPDGRVLVVGGDSTDLPHTGQRAELYDPTSGTFQLTGSLNVGRTGHGAVLLPGGRVLVTGGTPDGGGSMIPDEVWDPTSGAWTAVGTDVARHEPAVAALADGKVLVAGGEGDYPTVWASARLYDPASGTYTAADPMVTARSSATATLLADGRVLIAGGHGAAAVGEGAPVLASAELFDPATLTFGPAAPMHAARALHTATLLQDGRVLVAGGTDGSTELYDPVANTWSVSAPFKASRSTHGAALLDDGSVVFLGGQSPSGQLLSSVERWMPSQGMVGGDALDVARRSFGLATLDGGALLVAGGIDHTGYTTSASIYTYSCTPGATCLSGWCGPHPDGCGGDLDCGGCASGAVCGYGLCCVPATCASLGLACGTASDGCGGTLTCTCGAGAVCTPSRTCCVPTTCEALGRTCGTASDGCGGTVSCGTCGADQVCSSAGVCEAVQPGFAAYDPVLQAPRCWAPGSCDSGPLLTGRAGLGPEIHAPNTLRASCPDATYGTFHGSESLDRLRVSASDGGSLAPGKTARVEATVWAYASDKLDLYVTADALAASPAWTFIATLTPAGASAVTLSSTFKVPAGGSDVKAVRGVFRWGGVAGPCPGGAYTDVDDLVFSAALPPDAAPPTVAITSPAAGAVLTGTATIAVAVTDDVGVTAVSCSDGGHVVGSASAPPFSVTWNTRLSANGAHAITCTASDASGRSATSAPVSVTTQNDLQAPTIAFTAPAPGARVAGYVSVKVAAADDVGVVRVDYQLDGASLSYSTTAPFGLTWNANYTANGSHTLTAIAKDAAGNTATATLPVVVDHDATPPTVALAAPAEGAVLGGTVLLTAAASDDVGVTHVEFYDGTSYLGAATTAPYQLSWYTAGVANGAHALTARAYDACLNVGKSAPVNVTVSNDRTAPTVAVTSPAGGAVVSGVVTLTASASDNVGVTRVSFYVDGTWVCDASAPPWACAWNTAPIANGSHALLARAQDAALNVATSQAVAISVSNSAPGGATAWDATLRAPRCGAAASCDSGTLLAGRAGLGPEANAPNTIGSSCADGSSGSYHVDESLDRLKVSTVDGTPLAAGKTVRVEATVWAYSSYTSDKLDLYYAADASAPSWTFLGTLSPTRAGAQTLSTTYTLPAGALQAVRGTFRFSGSAGPCTTGGYDDHDDLVFAVQ